MPKWYALVILLAGLDQLSKKIVEANLNFAETVAVLPFFNLRLVYNEGAAFSFLSEAGGWQRWFFVLLALAVCIYIIYWLKTLRKDQKLLGLSLSLILSGAIGNLIDRILYAKVTDFLDLYYPSQTECIYFFFKLPQNTCHWPTFNLADIFISLGAGLLFIDMLRSKPTNNENH